MQVLTLDTSSFSQHAARLAQMVEESSIGRFDAIVAVRRGGSFVCDVFCRHFPKGMYGARYDITLQRPSTKRKSAVISTILKSLPMTMLNLMRMAESSLLSLRRKIKGPSAAPYVEMPNGLADILNKEEKPNILIIDDAIDSGDTLFAIIETLRKANVKVAIRIAVMTETTSHPRVRADYSLYRNKTLIRFPWSNDYKLHRQEPLL